MKKLVCMLLALLLAAGLTLTALAEANAATAQPAETANPDDAAPDDEGLDAGALDDAAQADQAATPNVASTRAADGTVNIDGQYTLVCPEALVPIDVDQQDLADGLLFSAYSDTMGMDVYKYPQGEDTLESLYESYKADGDMTEVMLPEVGGVKVLVYRIDETGIDATLAGDSGYLYDIMFTYQTNDEYAQVGQMIASIKKTGA